MDAPNQHGATPLHAAVASGASDAIPALLSAVSRASPPPAEAESACTRSGLHGPRDRTLLQGLRTSTATHRRSWRANWGTLLQRMPSVAPAEGPQAA